jgi:hypothetical protein
MATKRTMTLNLSGQEMAVLEKLAREEGVTKTALMRQALRLYQSMHVRVKRGEKLFSEGRTNKEKSELVFIGLPE